MPKKKKKLNGTGTRYTCFITFFLNDGKEKNLNRTTETCTGIESFLNMIVVHKLGQMLIGQHWMSLEG